jgi:hypothetical protein
LSHIFVQHQAQALPGTTLLARSLKSLSWECWQHVGNSMLATCWQHVKMSRILSQQYPDTRFSCRGLPILYPILRTYVCTKTQHGLLTPPAQPQPQPCYSAAPLLCSSPATATSILPLLLLFVCSSSSRIGVAAAGEQWSSGCRITAAAAVLNCCCCLDAIAIALWQWQESSGAAVAE